jgi:hypothetical protein
VSEFRVRRTRNTNVESQESIEFSAQAEKICPSSDFLFFQVFNKWDNACHIKEGYLLHSVY